MKNPFALRVEEAPLRAILLRGLTQLKLNRWHVANLIAHLQKGAGIGNPKISIFDKRRYSRHAPIPIDS
jgi:hypothetical protein